MTNTDIAIFFTIITIFIVVGVMLPFVQEEFTGSSTTVGVDNLRNEIGAETGSEGSINAFTIIGSVASMFFWTFGDLPLWLDSFFLILRVSLIWLLVRMIRGVG